MNSDFHKQIASSFSFLPELGFDKLETSKGKEQFVIYKRENQECSISWSKKDSKPSMTYEDDTHLLGILDCEQEIRAIHKDLPEHQQEFLAWVFSAMSLEEYLNVFSEKVKSIIHE